MSSVDRSAAAAHRLLVITTDSSFANNVREALSGLHILPRVDETIRPDVELDESRFFGCLVDLDTTEDFEAESAARLYTTICVGRDAERLSGLTTRYHCDPLVRDEADGYLKLLAPMLRKKIHEVDRDQTRRDAAIAAEARHQRLLEALPDIVYKIDPDGRFMYLNPAVRGLGYEPSELLGEHFETILPTGEAERVSLAPVVERIRESGHPPDRPPGLFDERRGSSRRSELVRLRLKRKTPSRSGDADMVGRVVAYGELSSTGDYRTDEPEPHFTGTVGIIRDISEQEKGEERLRMLTAAFEYSPVAVAVIERNGEIVLGNEKLFALARKPPGEVVGGQAKDLLFGSSELWEEVQATLGEDGPNRRDVELKGTWFELFSCAIYNPLEEQAVLFFVDVNERRRLAEDLEEGLKYQTSLLRELNHRVLNSLQVVSSLLSLQDSLVDADHPSRGTAANIARLATIAAAHELLHAGRSTDLPLGDYLRHTLEQSIENQERVTGFRTDIEPVRVDLDRAVPIGLLVNEWVLVTRPDTELVLTGSRNGSQYELCLGPRDAFLGADISQFTRQLSEALIDQLGGHLSEAEDAYCFSWPIGPKADHA